MDADLEQRWAQWSDYITDGILEDLHPSPVRYRFFFNKCLDILT